MTPSASRIETQLCQLRDRVNFFSTQHAVYTFGTLLAVLASGLVYAGLRMQAEVFGFLTWSALAVLAIGLVTVGLLARSRRVDLGAAARLADRHAGLQERLTSVVALPADTLDRGYGPVLVAQAADSRPRWEPHQVFPRKVPRSIGPFALSLLLLLVTTRLAPTSASSPREQAGKPESSAAAMPVLNLLAGGRESRPSSDEPGLDSSGSARGDDPEAGAFDEERSEDGAGAAGVLAMIPERLQGALRRTFDAGAVPERSGEDGDDEAGMRHPGESRMARAPKPGEPTREDVGARPATDTSDPRKPQPGAIADARRQADSAGGDAAPAGDAPATGPLFGATAATEGGTAAPTFKLTLSSFLVAAGSGDVAQRRTTGAAGRGDDAESPVEISPEQSDELSLHKAKVSAEFEDIVQRAYARTEP